MHAFCMHSPGLVQSRGPHPFAFKIIVGRTLHRANGSMIVSSSPLRGRLTSSRAERKTELGLAWEYFPQSQRPLRWKQRLSISRYGGQVTESRTVTLPVVVARDEDGVWCAHAQLRPGVGAHGEGDTEEAALEDLRVAQTGLIEEFGVPRELSITVAA